MLSSSAPGRNWPSVPASASRHTTPTANAATAQSAYQPVATSTVRTDATSDLGKRFRKERHCAQRIASAWSRISQPFRRPRHLFSPNHPDEDVFQALRPLSQLGDHTIHHDSPFMNNGDAFAEALHHFQDVGRKKDGGP